MLRCEEVPDCVGDSGAIEIWRFYVDRPWHGLGLAQTLMSAVRECAVQKGARTLWLGVWEKNPRAIAFYEKCGFRDVGAHDFWVGSDRQTDRIMVASLSDS
jgi:GNAT superfamily N-acetyltransferase